MVNLETVEREILDLEHRDTSYAVVERLSWLYIVRNELRKQRDAAEPVEVQAVAVREVEPLEGSEFLEAASQAPYEELLQVLNEHLDAVKVVFPKEYEAVMAKIKAL